MLWMKEEETVSVEACLIITPFGSPVVPLVYRMYWIESPAGIQSSSFSTTGSSYGTQLIWRCGGEGALTSSKWITLIDSGIASLNAFRTVLEGDTLRRTTPRMNVSPSNHHRLQQPPRSNSCREGSFSSVTAMTLISQWVTMYLTAFVPSVSYTGTVVWS